MRLVSKIFILCGHDPPTSQTDRQTACDSKTVLCTIVHHAVKIFQLQKLPKRNRPAKRITSSEPPKHSDPSGPVNAVNSCIFVAVLYFPVFLFVSCIFLYF